VQEAAPAALAPARGDDPRPVRLGFGRRQQRLDALEHALDAHDHAVEPLGQRVGAPAEAVEVREHR